MSVNVADFEVRSDYHYESVYLICPGCSAEISGGLTEIRDLITAASSHAVNVHPMSAPDAIKGA